MLPIFGKGNWDRGVAQKYHKRDSLCEKNWLQTSQHGYSAENKPLCLPGSRHLRNYFLGTRRYFRCSATWIKYKLVDPCNVMCFVHVSEPDSTFEKLPDHGV
jgi:hypothetical protein